MDFSTIKIRVVERLLPSNASTIPKNIFLVKLSSLIKDFFLVPIQCPQNCQGYEEILRLLFDKNAKVATVDKDGNTAVDATIAANESQGKGSQVT